MYQGSLSIEEIVDQYSPFLNQELYLEIRQKIMQALPRLIPAKKRELQAIIKRYAHAALDSLYTSPRSFRDNPAVVEAIKGNIMSFLDKALVESKVPAAPMIAVSPSLIKLQDAHYLSRGHHMEEMDFKDDYFSSPSSTPSHTPPAPMAVPKIPRGGLG